MDRRIYNNLPPYARLADEKGVLEHICETIQPEYDIMERVVEQQPFRFDVSIAPEESLRWLGQIVTLAGVENHWLGIGINPAWSAQQTRNAIARIWKYLQIKGTEAGIREAIAIWLMWEAALNPEKLKIILPFGKTPTNSPPKHWGWDIPYGYHLLQSWDERKQFGGINTTHYSYYPNWFFIQNPTWGWEYYEDWHNRTLVQIIASEDTKGAPYLGAEQPWMHFHLTEEDWNRVVPDILTLNYEIWSALAEPTVNLWYEPFIGSDKGIELRFLEIEEEKKFITITELEIDGHKWIDPYFTPTENIQQIVEVTTFQSEFQFYPGASWEDLYAGMGNDLVYKGGEKIVLESILIEGIYPGASWEDLYVGLESINFVETIISEENGNFDIERNWSVWFVYNDEWWYFPARNITVLAPEPFDEESYWGTTYYSPTYFSVIETVRIEDSVYSPITPGTPYFASLQEYITTEKTVIDTGENICTPGKIIEVESDRDTQKIVRLLEEPTLLLEFAKGSKVETITVVKTESIYPGCQWYQFYPTTNTEILSKNAIILSEIDVSNLQPLSIDDIDSFLGIPEQIKNLDEDIYSIGYGFIDTSSYYYRPYSETIIKVTTEVPDGWQIKNPTSIATWIDEYDSGRLYLYNGKEEIVEIIVDDTENSLVNLCNIFEFFTTREILVWNEYQVPIELSEDAGRRIEDLYPDVKNVLNSQNWHLIIETKEELVALLPMTTYLEVGSNKTKTVVLSQDTDPKKLFLEFVYKSYISTKILSVSLLLQDRSIFFNNFDEALNLPDRAVCTFSFKIPLTFEVPVLNTARIRSPV